LAEFGSLTTSQLVEKVRGLQELAFQLGLEEGKTLMMVPIRYQTVMLGVIVNSEFVKCYLNGCSQAVHHVKGVV